MRGAAVVGLAAVLAAAFAAPAMADVDHDGQQWTQLNAQGPIGGRWVVYAEVQPRFTDGVSRLGQLLVRPAVGYQLSKSVQAMVGYAYADTDPLNGRQSHENRAWQQLSWPIFGRSGGVVVNARTRFEQRTVVGASDVGLRLRQQVRVQAPFRTGGKLGVVASSEAFYAFDSTDWGQREGFEQIRNFVGLTVPLAKGLSAEPGYLNQYQVRSGPNRMAHVANLTLAYRW